jgi:hypothetical protein
LYCYFTIFFSLYFFFLIRFHKLVSMFTQLSQHCPLHEMIYSRYYKDPLWLGRLFYDDIQSISTIYVSFFFVEFIRRILSITYLNKIKKSDMPCYFCETSPIEGRDLTLAVNRFCILCQIKSGGGGVSRQVRPFDWVYSLLLDNWSYRWYAQGSVYIYFIAVW